VFKPMAAGRKQHLLTAAGGREGVTSTAGGEEPTAPARMEETIFLLTGAKKEATSMATGRKQHSSTAT